MARGRGRGRAADRGHGRGRGPAVTPPPAEEVVGEGAEEVASAAHPAADAQAASVDLLQDL